MGARKAWHCLDRTSRWQCCGQLSAQNPITERADPKQTTTSATYSPAFIMWHGHAPSDAITWRCTPCTHELTVMDYFWVLFTLIVCIHTYWMFIMPPLLIVCWFSLFNKHSWCLIFRLLGFSSFDRVSRWLVFIYFVFIKICCSRIPTNMHSVL